MNTVSFITLGCRLNQAEEERLRRQFSESGFFVSAVPSADIIIINTCSVTQLADKKSRQKIRSIMKENSKAKIVVMGCGAEEAKDIDGVDLFIKNSEKPNAFKIITKKYGAGSTSLMYISEASKRKIKSKRTRALLKVQDGCNNFCSYCIVPFMRGREISVPVSDVLSEAKKLDELGHQELVISGVNVGKYHDNSVNLVGLIEQILKNTSFPRIRLSSINPQDITSEIIDLWAQEERLCEHFHLSLQSGSTTVLKRMKRPYTAEKYAEAVEIIREKIPNIAITTDVIVGFPGETEKEFEETCKFVKSIGFAKLHVFPYSIRKDTKAAEMPNQIDVKIKKIRAERLRKIGDELRTNYQNQFIDKELPVLFEEQKGDYWYGLTPNYIRIKHKSKEDLFNKVLKIDLSEDNII